ncbi:MAG TPA: hypothetical protein VFM96_10150 [Gaiellaceae bacterium]|nr:hypothetical protein [Gaiellaceae bacterium]
MTGLANDMAQIPGGAVQLGEAEYGVMKNAAEHFGQSTKAGFQGPTGWGALFSHPEAWYHAVTHPAPGADKAAQLVGGVLSNTAKSLTDPHYIAQHPDQALLSGVGLLSGGSGLAARAGAVADATRAGDVGDVLKAAVTKPVMPPRLINIGDTQVPFKASQNAVTRGAQAVHDMVIQRALNTNPNGLVGGYATKRLGGSLAETRRYQEAITSAPAAVLQKVGKQLDPTEQAALRLTSENSTPEEAAAFHFSQADAGIAPDQNRAMGNLYRQVSQRGLLTRDAAGNVVVDADAHPQLAAVDALLAKGGAERDAILQNTGQMSEEGLASRTNLPGQIRRAGIPESERAGSIFAGEGRNYVPYYEVEGKAPKTPIAGASSSIVGRPQKIVSQSKAMTGANLEQGIVPDNTTGLVARQMARAYRYANTDAFRRGIVKTGSDVRRTNRDVLVSTQELANAQVPEELRAQLNGGTLTRDELAGHALAYDAWREQLFHPGSLTSKFAPEKSVSLGSPAPEGFRWVDRNLLGDLAAPPVGPTTKLGKVADNVNAFQTAATVYLKLGHFATRYGTNAAANAVQGSLHNLPRAFQVWRSLSDLDKGRALAAGGQAAAHALPMEGMGPFARAARPMANWWAVHADAPFRFNSLAYEARKAGFDTPEKFSGLLDKLQAGPNGIPASEWARIDGIAKTANREAIAYDRLSPFEKRVLTRAVWFYPWVKGSSSFALNTLLEHPLKSAALGNLSEQAQQRQASELGPLPSYAQGLFKVGGSATQPLVEDLSTISPFATAGDVLRSAANINKPTEAEQLSSYLNPALSAAGRAAYNQNMYGQSVTSHYGKPPKDAGVLHNLLAGIGSTTPELAIWKATHAPADQSKRMYPLTPRYGLLKFLLGSVTPRTMNRSVANANTQKELTAAGR